ncbi:MAG TPA: DUF4175 family protein [Lacipirellulaceae bacterium]
MNFELRHKLERVARRIRSLRLWTALAVCWLLCALVGIVLFQLASRGGGLQQFDWRALAILAATSAVACFFAAFRTARDQRAVARRIEARHPELGTLLLTAVEQAALPREQLGYLQSTVIRDALKHGRRHNWSGAVSSWKLQLARLASMAALGLLVGVCIGLANRTVAHGASGGLLSTLGDLRDLHFEVKVDPGNAEVERGTSLVVVAEFAGAVPPEATLVVAGDATDRHVEEMVRSLDDPKFVGRVPAVENDLSYHVEFAGRRSETYRVKVFDYPELERADVKLVYPEYTSLPPAVIEDVRQVTAVEGSKITLAFRLNKEVSEARLVESGGGKVELKQHPKDATIYRTSWTLAKSRRFKLQLVDRDGRGNRLPAEMVVNVTPNRPPTIKFERPARDVEVSSIEELQLKASLSDDFGVVRSGLTYAVGGGKQHDVMLADLSAVKPQGAATQQAVDHLLEFESLKAEPDQLISYFIWAEDIGPDGKPRRTSSDMYFAEVRPFEEIYRQGEQPTQNEQQQQQQQQLGAGNAQEAGELAELQKEIINATWKLARRETRAEPTPEFPADAKLIEESQQSAIERLKTLAERVEDSESLAHVQLAQSHMDEAFEQLKSAAEGRGAEPLRQALSAEQAAYQALLKLRAREFQVVRGAQQRGGANAGQGGNSRSQRQLDQLQLRADENRYETQSRAANPEENAAQRESREILNRLRDLARRQEDLNERLRELQSALEQARTPQEREELTRELKRLRDQQQEILRDTDELASRVDRQGDQQQAQDARRQLEESRSHVQQASEALEQGQLSQAVTEGTRAGRQLNELRDQFRQQAANRFSEEMTEMRRAARNLDEQQQRLSEQLNEQNQGPGRSLRDTGARAEVAEGLGEQRQQLGELLDEMRQTIEEAEEPEPLLSKQLYDTVREAHQQRVENAIDVARRLVDVGIEREAGRVMRVADEGVSRLREGVERAAESVLGDESEALRRAQRQVDRLAEELNREIGQAQADQPADAESEQQREGNGAGQGNRSSENQRDGTRSGASAPRDTSEQQAENQQRGGQAGDDSQQRRDENEQSNQQEGRRGNGSDQRSNRDEQQRDGRPQSGQQRDRQQGNGQQQRGGQQGDGQQGDGENPFEEGREGERGNAQRSSLRGGGDRQRNEPGGGLEQLFNRDGGGLGGPGGPITGEDFRNWADRLRDVEQMLEDPELRSEAARILDRAEDARADFKRHSKEPDWTKLQDLVSQPLVELSRRIDDEIRRLESPDALVPIDRDPVPPEYAEQVRRYYERLGSGE